MSDQRHEKGREPWRERFDDLKEVYALGALTGEERREFEGLLAAYPELRTEVDGLNSIVDLLALAPQEHEPSPELRRNLLNSIGDPSDALSIGDSPRRVGLGRFSGLGGRIAAAVAAVAVVAVVGLSVWNTSLRQENEGLRGEIESRQTYALEGTVAAQDVRGEVVRLGDGQAVLVTEDLPPAPEGQVYEAWLMRGGVPEPAGLFEPHDGGGAATPIEGSLRGVDTVAVTIEPAGGSPAPTSDMLLTAEL